jgi:hypothetical protein
VSATRVPFDLELPFIVAAQELACGGRRFARGDAFPWHELGVSELDVLQLYGWLKVDCVVPPAVSPPKGKLKKQAQTRAAG